MKITGINIKDLVTFQFADIRELQVKFTSPLQIIIGTNGSGKTHLLSQLFIKPPFRTEYKKTGYKHLFITHNNKSYQLISDFRNKDKPHQFICDNEDLNPAGNTSIQEELLLKHFRYSKILEDIVFNRLSITKMSLGERRSFFMEHDPSDVGFILSIQKRTSSQIRGHTSTLATLTTRKLELETEVIDNEREKTYRDQLVTLEKRLDYLIKTIIELKVTINTLPQSSLVNQRELANTIVKKRQLLNRILFMIDKEADIYDLDLNVHILMASSSTLSNNLEDLNHQKLEIKTQLENTTDDEVAIQHKLLINKYIAKIEELKLETTNSPLQRDILDEQDSILSGLEWLLNPFKNQSYSYFYSHRKIRAKENILHQYKYKISNIKALVKQYQDRLDILIQETSQTLDVNPCAKSKCFLYLNYMKRMNEVDNETAFLTQNIQKLTTKLHRYSIFVEKLEEQLIEIGNVVDLINPIEDYLKKHKLKEYFIDNDFYSLKINPDWILTKAKNIFIRSNNYYEIISIENKKREEESTFGNKTVLVEHTKKKLEEEYDKIDKKYQKILVEYNAILTQITQKKSELKLLKEYESLKSYFTSMAEQLPIIMKEEQKKYERIKFEKVLVLFEEDKNRIITKMGEINIVLKKQASIKERLSEVLTQIDTVTKQKEELSFVYDALVQIPIQRSIQFINKVIQVINMYIRMVFTYQLNILPIDPMNTLTYKLPIQVEDIIVPDISLCSKAQTEMIDLAFGMAIRTLLEYNDFPIYLDEFGEAFDQRHKQKFLEFIQYILDYEKVSQIFMINHNAIIHEAFTESETLVLNTTNILTPPKYNEHAIFNKK